MLGTRRPMNKGKVLRELPNYRSMSGPTGSFGLISPGFGGNFFGPRRLLQFNNLNLPTMSNHINPLSPASSSSSLGSGSGSVGSEYASDPFIFPNNPTELFNQINQMNPFQNFNSQSEYMYETSDNYITPFNNNNNNLNNNLVEQQQGQGEEDEEVAFNETRIFNDARTVDPMVAVWSIDPGTEDAQLDGNANPGDAFRSSQEEHIQINFNDVNTTNTESIRIYENSDCSGPLAAIVRGETAPNQPIVVPASSACVMYVTNRPLAGLSDYSHFEANYETVSDSDSSGPESVLPELNSILDTFI